MGELQSGLVGPVGFFGQLIIYIASWIIQFVGEAVQIALQKRQFKVR